MARINRSDVIQKAVNDLAISTSSDKIPNETLDKIQLTYDLNKKFSNFIFAFGQSTSGTFNNAFPSVSAGSEIYLTAVTMSYAKDAACDIATGNIALSVTPDSSNVSTILLRSSVITLTAQNSDITLSFPYPIKIKAGSPLVVSGTFSLGVLRRDFTAVGFITSSN